MFTDHASHLTKAVKLNILLTEMVYRL